MANMVVVDDDDRQLLVVIVRMTSSRASCTPNGSCYRAPQSIAGSRLAGFCTC